MSTLLTDTWRLFLRAAANTARMPAFLVISIVQPVIWLLLFGQLFGAVAQLPGFSGGSYLQFLAPGVMVMTAMFSSTFSGLALLADIDRGVLDRLLATPVSRPALVLSRILYSALQVVLQASVLLLVAVLLGAEPRGGLPGLGAALLAAALLSAAFAGFSNAITLLTRRHELVIAISNFTVLPMTFSSSMLMDPGLMPAWIQGVARFNPLNWAVTAARDGFEGRATAEMLLCLLLLTGFATLCSLATLGAFRRFLRSL